MTGFSGERKNNKCYELMTHKTQGLIQYRWKFMTLVLLSCACNPYVFEAAQSMSN